MNQPNNERFQKTDARIIDAFIALLSKKELSEITVSEICRRCSIHRTSFYLHFQDVYDMMERIEIRLAEYYAILFEPNGENYNLGNRFEHLFTFIYEHQAFYRAYWSHYRNLRVLDAALSKNSEQKLRQEAANYGFQGDAELQYHRTFFKAGLAALIGYWLNRECRETPEELASILKKEYQQRSQFLGK